MATVSNVQGDRSVELVPRHKVDIGEGDVLEPMTTRGERRDPLPPVETVVTRSGGNSAPERIVFSEPVELSEGIHLANRDAATAGYEIRETTVRDVIARCVRIAAPQGRVVGNVFDGSSNPSVLVESYTGPIWAPWMWVEDLTIVDNEIRRSGLNGWANRRPSGILLHHKSPAGDVNTGRPHQGIRIVGNDIGPTGAEGLRLGDGRHLTVEHNEIEHPNRFEYEQLREEVGYGMGLENVGGAQIADNTVRGSVDELSAFAWGRRSDDISLSENRLEVDGTSIEPRFLRG